jgi:hypothetical protein
MRRLVVASGLVAVVAAAAGLTGCSAVMQRVGVLPAVLTTPSPTATTDPATTRAVCQDASSALTYTQASFAVNLDAIDQAAAQGNQAQLMAAADAIQNRLLGLAESLVGWASQPVPLTLRSTLLNGAATLRTITGSSYSGNQADIAQQLQDMSHALAGVCR